MNDEFSLEKTPGENTKISIDQILNNKTGLKKKPKTAEDKRRDSFVKFITCMEAANVRSEVMFDEFELDYSKYNETYEDAIEGLLYLQFNEKQISFIDFYIYERWDEEGELLDVQTASGESIELKTPVHLWEYLKTIK